MPDASSASSPGALGETICTLVHHDSGEYLYPLSLKAEACRTQDVGLEHSVSRRARARSGGTV